VCLGWIVLVSYFRIFGDAVSYSVAYWLFGWTIERGYGIGDYGPFYICATVVSLIGFLVSGFVATRWQRTGVRASLLGFVISIETAVVASVLALVVINQPTAVPHTWFYAIWLGLPSNRYIGFVLTPIFAGVGGWLGCRAWIDSGD
jgi:hypothetical protein